MSEKQYNAMKTLARYAFAAYDAQLYLDAYPTDQGALEFYREMKKSYAHAVEEYERDFGPVSAASAADGNGWSWTDGPWPWQTERGGCTSCGRM